MTIDLTLKEALQVYMHSLEQAGKSSRTLYTYGKDFEQICAFFAAGKQVSSITLPLVGRFYKSDELLRLPDGKERAEQTVKKTIRVFRMFMVWAYENRYIDFLPLPKATPMGNSVVNVTHKSGNTSQKR